MNSIETKLESLKKQSCELLVTIKKLYETDYVHDEKNFRYLTERLEILSEKYSCCVRELAINSFVMKECEVYDTASEMLGIEVHKENESIIIDLPSLLPGKKERETNFIGAPLRHQFEKICQNRKVKIKEKAVVCIIHIYDNKNKKPKCYDYDNLESKRIIDIITAYTLTDDSPKYCDVYHSVEFGNTNKTRIIVMPKSEFEKFRNSRDFS